MEYSFSIQRNNQIKHVKSLQNFIAKQYHDPLYECYEVYVLDSTKIIFLVTEKMESRQKTNSFVITPTKTILVQLLKKQFWTDIGIEFSPKLYRLHTDFSLCLQKCQHRKCWPGEFFQQKNIQLTVFFFIDIFLYPRYLQ